MTGISRALDRMLAGLDRVLIVLAVLCLIVLVGVVFVAVLLRYVFNAPMLFSFDLSTLLFAWVVFIGLAIADRDDGHMGLDLVPALASARLQNVVIALRYLVVLALAVFLTWIGYQLFNRTGAQIPSLRISARWLYASMPIGFGLLALSYIGRLTRHFAGWGR